MTSITSQTPGTGGAAVGGGIYNSASLLLANRTISGNTASATQMVIRRD
jgi:hypothetical protein